MSDTSVAAETVFFDRGGITITQTRIITQGETYALSGVTSARAVEDPPKRALAIIIAVVISLIVAAANVVMGVLVLAGAIVAILLLMKPVYEINLATAGGESVAFKSPDKALVWEAYQAIQQAIVARG